MVQVELSDADDLCPILQTLVSMTIAGCCKVDVIDWSSPSLPVGIDDTYSLYNDKCSCIYNPKCIALTTSNCPPFFSQLLGKIWLFNLTSPVNAGKMSDTMIAVGKQPPLSPLHPIARCVLPV